MKKKQLLPLAALGPILILAYFFLNAGVRLEVCVVDDATGVPLAARVAITDYCGKSVEIDGRHEHVDQLNKRWCYVDGSFSVAIPNSGATIEIRRGLEVRPLSEALPGQTTEKALARTFRLRRWTDMRSKGYLNGDIHAHLPALSHAALQMKAEDLNALTLLALAGLDIPTNRSFKGKVDESSSPGCEIYVGQEVIDWHLGHLTLAGLKKMVPDYPAPGGALEYWLSNPHLDILRAARETRDQKGFVSWAHFENLPGAESPVAVALGLLDAIELPTWSDPMQLPAHLTPWDTSGLPTAEFTPMRGADLYYLFLNAGFRVPLAAGTDKTGDDIPIGSNRVYVQPKGRADYSGWLAGIKAGTGFVTNGPILEFEAEGHQAGEIVEFQGTRTIKARVTARSIVPFTTLEILSNGRPVAHKLKLVQTNPPIDGIYSMETEATITLEESAWLAARALSNPDITPRLMPREGSVFAHTSPVYFLRDGQKVREDASIQYLRRYVRGLLHWLSTKPAFSKEKDRAAVQRDAEQALRIYEEL
jgi:hypothetical protein